MKPYFVVEAYTNVGRVRRNNEDNYYVNGKYLENAELDDYFIIDIPMQKGVFGVFDGMGGHSDGDFASYTAAKTLAGYQHDLLKNPDPSVEDYVMKANSRICTEIQRTQTRIGTTMALAVINEDKLKVYNIGDTRIYYFRDGKIYQVSKDHTIVNQLVEAGLMTREQAAVDQRKNELSQHLGIMLDEMVIQPFASQEIEWGEDDVLLMCSDGVTDALSDQELEDIVNQCSHKGFFAEHIVKTAIRKGSQDNATAIVVQACGKNGIKGKKKGGTSKKKYAIIASVLAACLAVGCVAGIALKGVFKKDSEPETTKQAVVETTTEPTTEKATETTTVPTTAPDSSTTQQTGNLDASAPAVTKTNPQITTLKTDLGVVDLRNRPQMGAEYVIREETEAREVKIYAHTLENGFYWVYIELDSQFYWVRADGITDAIIE